MARKSLYRYLDTNGDGTGDKHAIGDYSVTSADFRITCPIGNGIFTLERMMIYLEDVGSMDADSYGNGITLTNGIEVLHLGTVGNVETDLTDGLPVLNNGHWSRVCFDIASQTYGQGSEYISGRWTFSKSGRELYLTPGETFAVRLNDDFTGLLEHTFMVQGVHHDTVLE